MGVLERHVSNHLSSDTCTFIYKCSHICIYAIASANPPNWNHWGNRIRGLLSCENIFNVVNAATVLDMRMLNKPLFIYTTNAETISNQI